MVTLILWLLCGFLSFTTSSGEFAQILAVSNRKHCSNCPKILPKEEGIPVGDYIICETVDSKVTDLSFRFGEFKLRNRTNKISYKIDANTEPGVYEIECSAGDNSTSYEKKIIQVPLHNPQLHANEKLLDNDKIVCEASGDPKPVVQLRLYQKPYNYLRSVTGLNDATLVVQEDIIPGNYSIHCVTENNISTRTYRVDLHREVNIVVPLSSVTIIPADLESVVHKHGDDIACYAFGDPIPRVEVELYQFIGMVYQEARSTSMNISDRIKMTTMMIPGPIKSGAYVFKCTAMTEYGGEHLRKSKTVRIDIKGSEDDLEYGDMYYESENDQAQSKNLQIYGMIFPFVCLVVLYIAAMYWLNFRPSDNILELEKYIEMTVKEEENSDDDSDKDVQKFTDDIRESRQGQPTNVLSGRKKKGKNNNTIPIFDEFALSDSPDSSNWNNAL